MSSEWDRLREHRQGPSIHLNISFNCSPHKRKGSYPHPSQQPIPLAFWRRGRQVRLGNQGGRRTINHLERKETELETETMKPPVECHPVSHVIFRWRGRASTAGDIGEDAVLSYRWKDRSRSKSRNNKATTRVSSDKSHHRSSSKALKGAARNTDAICCLNIQITNKALIDQYSCHPLPPSSNTLLAEWSPRVLVPFYRR